MASPVVNSKIFNPVMPSLFHMALVKVTLPLYNEYDCEILDKIMTSISHENSTTSHADIQENPEESYNKAREKLLDIPALFRQKVMATVFGIKYEVENWLRNHFYFGEISSNNISSFKFVFYWRSDGTINTVKTAQELVLNKSFHIINRFQLASVYCFANEVQTLWAEIKASGMADSFFFRASIHNFWVKWIQNGSPGHWTEALLLEEGFLALRFSSFLPSLQPEDRQKFVCRLTPSCSFSSRIDDDLRHCLYALTKEEEEQVMQINAEGILLMFLKWPLNTVFLETARKMFSYITYSHLGWTIPLTLYEQRFREESDYRKLLEGFWRMTPDDYKDHWRESTYIRKKIDNFFMENRLAQAIAKMSRKKLTSKHS